MQIRLRRSAANESNCRGASASAGPTVLGLSSIEHDDCSCEMDCGEEISGRFVIAGRDSAKLFELAEEIFDEVARHVAFPVEGTHGLARTLWRNDRGYACCKQGLDNALVCIEGFVGQHGVGFHLRQQLVRAFQIVRLPTGEEEGNRVAQRVNQSVYLGAQSASAAAYGLIFAFFFWAPALC